MVAAVIIAFLQLILWKDTVERPSRIGGHGEAMNENYSFTCRSQKRTLFEKQLQHEINWRTIVEDAWSLIRVISHDSVCCVTRSRSEMSTSTSIHPNMLATFYFHDKFSSSKSQRKLLKLSFFFRVRRPNTWSQWNEDSFTHCYAFWNFRVIRTSGVAPVGSIGNEYKLFLQFNDADLKRTNQMTTVNLNS